MKNLIIFLFIALMTSCGTSKNTSKNNSLFADNEVVAHRGAWKKNNLPQNSIASLKQAIALGCTGSEFNVRMTADDSLIINHDRDYHDMPASRGTWPAIWMLGKNRQEIGWPECGEIDIMEHVGYDADSIHATIHSKA